MPYSKSLMRSFQFNSNSNPLFLILPTFKNRILISGRRRKFFGNQQIFSLVDIVVDATSQTVIEHSVVESDILGICCFPFQVVTLHVPCNSTCPWVASTTLYVTSVISIVKKISMPGNRNILMHFHYPDVPS